jgi:pilus assembly protein CpaC
MHQTKRRSPTVYGTMLLGLLWGEYAAGVGLGQGAGPEFAAAAAQAAPAGSAQKPAPLPAPHPETGPGARPEFTITPRGRMLVVPIGVSKRLEMEGKKEIDTAINQRENVAVLAPYPGEPRWVMITGKEAGTTRVTLTARDGTQETYEVVVQLDVEYLRGILRRAVPTASIDLIPAASGAVIINGSVAHPEDIDVIVKAAASVLGSADRVINAMRVGGVQQVQLDVIVAQVSRSKARLFGFEFADQGLNHSIVSTFSGGGASSTTSNPTGNVASGSASFTPPSIGQSANVVIALFSRGDWIQSFFPFLTALTTENVAKILAEPHVVALSGHSAFFNSGGQQAVPQLASGGAGGSVAGVSFIPFGTTLEVLPIILGNGKIYLDIHPKVELPATDTLIATPVPGTNGSVFGRNGHEIHTSVVMEDGQTLVLGGLIQHTVDGTVHKWPCIGCLPYIGALFRSVSYTEGEEELLIIVTPHLVDAMACDQLPHTLPGQETRSPDDYELFLEGILEAPRGPRDVICGNHYVPAYKSGPTAGPSDAPEAPAAAAGPVQPAPLPAGMGASLPAGAAAAPATDVPSVKQLPTFPAADASPADPSAGAKSKSAL